MDIKVGDTLTTKDMQEFYGVTKDNWKKQKNKFLDNFGRYYEYEVEYKGRNINYKIIKVLDEYQAIQKKSDKRDKIYEDGIIDIISEDNIQTAANVARRLESENEDVISLNHTSGTIYEYTRVKMRNMFGTGVNDGGSKGMMVNKVWCRLVKEYNYYEEMTEKEIQAFFEIYSKSKDANKENELEIFSDYQTGLITREQMYELIGESGFNCYQSARNEFKNKYGYFPIKVPQYTLSAF